MWNNTTSNGTESLWTRHKFSPLFLVQTAEPWFIVVVLISLFGTFINGSLVFIICRHRALRNGAGILIANMVLIFGLMCITFCIDSISVWATTHGIPIPSDYCKYAQVPYAALRLASNWSSVVLALNRFIAICYPFQYDKWSGRKVTALLLIIPWALGLLIAFLNLNGIGGFFEISPIGQCFFEKTDGFGTFCFVIGGFIPYILEAFFAVGILTKIVRGVVARRAGTGILSKADQKASAQMQRRINIAKMLFVSSLFCFCCTLPVLLLYTQFVEIILLNAKLAIWIQLLVLGQFAINPLIFFLMNNDYRRGFLALGRRRAVFPTSYATRETGDCASKQGTEMT